MLAVWLAGFASGAAGSLTGCVTVQNLVGDGPKVYVAPFVDRSAVDGGGGDVGYRLWNATREAVYGSAPRRFLLVFDEAAVAVDAEVIAVGSVPVPGDSQQADVEVRAQYRLWRQPPPRAVWTSGVLRRRGRYRLDGPPDEVEARRLRALDVAIASLGNALAADILEASLALKTADTTTTAP